MVVLKHVGEIKEFTIVYVVYAFSWFGKRKYRGLSVLVYLVCVIGYCTDCFT
jgi:hypothetical protein